MLRACLQSPLTHPLCLSSCEQHEAFQAAAAIVAAAEADEREAEEAQEKGVVGSGEESEEGSGEESEAQGEGGTGSAARPRGKRSRRQDQEIERFSPGHEANRPQRATAAKKKHQTRNAAGYRDDGVDALFRAEVEKFTSSLAAELARR